MAGIKGQTQQRGIERRRRIVDAAFELFAQSGYQGTGVAAVAARAGVTPSAVIHHFGSKDRLLQAVLDEYDARAARRLAHHADGSLRGLVDALLDDAAHMAGHAGLVRLHVVLQAEHLTQESAVHARFRQRARLLRQHVADTLRTAQRAGELSPTAEPEAMATELLAFLEGAATLWLLDPDTVDLPALYRGYLNRLFPPPTAQTS